MHEPDVQLPGLLDKYRALAQTYSMLEAAIDRTIKETRDPALISALSTIKLLGGKIARSFIALRDLIQFHPATLEAEFVARFYFMNYSIISENARLGARIISYAANRILWLARHSPRIIESLKTLYTDLLSLEIECKERFRLAYNRDLSFDFAFRENRKREWGHELMSIEEAFGLLGLPLSSRHEEVKAAFRKLAKKYHPDINPQADRHQFILLERAYKRALSVVALPV